VYLHGTVVPVDRSLTARFASTSGTWLSVVPTVEPNSSAGETVARGVRAVAAPFPVLVGGQSAELVDSNRSLIDSLPLALGILAAITFVLLFIMFGSVVIPLKALVLNLLSLTATFGAMVWIFQQGHLSGVLHFTATGNLDATTPILMFCIAFGLSMDYEVFLLSRIKEEHDAGNDNVSAVAVGLERTGRLVTAAAVIISVVFLAFATSRVSFIKLFGLGLALAVLMDAFIIRGTLVPAFMRLAGDANWWAPRWLRRIHDRIGFHEGVDLEEAGPALPDGPGPVDLRPPDGVDPTLAEAAADSDSGGRVGVR
jgi:RND superfamily putative drug exporter